MRARDRILSRFEVRQQTALLRDIQDISEANQ
jgi:hypothetical protein